MIKYFPVQNEDGAIEAWSFINTRNETRIIVTENDIKNLFDQVFTTNKNLSSVEFTNIKNNSKILLNKDELAELSKLLSRLLMSADYVDATHAIQS